jgi:hypothetical protein
MPVTQRSEFTRTYNSFSGVDMMVMFGSVLIGELQGLSYTITREKAPLYTMGSADPRSFSRGKRGIAGSLIFLVFDRNALLSSMGGTKSGAYLANEYETPDSRIIEAAPDVFKEIKAGGSVGSATSGDTDGARLVNTGITARKVIAQARYHDQILPFDILVLASNEYGHSARMIIHNVEIMNCGSGMSIDDITTDESCTWVATSITPWHAQTWLDPRTGKQVDVEQTTPWMTSGAGRSVQ